MNVDKDYWLGEPLYPGRMNNPKGSVGFWRKWYIDALYRMDPFEVSLKDDKFSKWTDWMKVPEDAVIEKLLSINSDYNILYEDSVNAKNDLIVAMP